MNMASLAAFQPSGSVSSTSSTIPLECPASCAAELVAETLPSGFVVDGCYHSVNRKVSVTRENCTQTHYNEGPNLPSPR
jgi:hypothetical protein